MASLKLKNIINSFVPFFGTKAPDIDGDLSGFNPDSIIELLDTMSIEEVFNSNDIVKNVLSGDMIFVINSDEELTSEDSIKFLNSGGTTVNYKDSDGLFYYSVKNPSVDDVNAGITLHESFPFPHKYYVLKFNTSHTFDGTEDWVVKLNYIDLEQSSINPVYTNAQLGDTGFVIGRKIHYYAERNRVWIRQFLDYSFSGHLIKNGAVWTAQQKSDFYSFVDPFVSASLKGDIGVVMAMAQAAVPESVVTQEMIDHFIGLCTDYKKKFPDGTI